MAADRATVAADLIEQARAASSSGAPATAERILHRAIRSLTHPDATPRDQRLRATATIALAAPVFERRGLSPALDLLGQADHLLDGPDGDGIRTLSRVQRAGFLARAGDWGAAVSMLSGIGTDDAWLTGRQLVSVHLNRASAHQYLGHHDRAIGDLRVALDLASRHHCLDLEFKARHNLGYSHFLVGDVPAALRAMGEADRMDVDVARATAKRDHAQVLLESGLLDEATTLLAEALRIATERRLHHEVGETLVDIARLELLRGDGERALAVAREAARLFRRRGADGWWVQAEILRAESLLACGTGRAGARRLVERLQSLPTQSRAVRLDARLVATEASLVAGDIEGAQALFRGTRASPTSPSARLRHDWIAARLALAAGDRARARRRLREAARRVAEQQDRPASLDARTAFALHAQKLVGLDVGLAVETSARATLAASERWRAATARLPTLVPHPDVELDERFTRLRALRQQLRDAGDSRRTDRLGLEIVALERAIRHREWELADHDRRPVVRAPARAGECVTHAAATDTDVLSLLAVRGRLLAVTISTAGVQLHDLGGSEEVAERTRQVLADLAVLGRVLPSGLTEVVRRSLHHRLDELARMLPIPRTRSRLLLVPTRVLRSIPWRMIDGMHDRPLVVTPSLAAWLLPPTHTAGKVVAIAGPGLARAATEIDAVAAPWGTSATVLPDATGADLAEALRTAHLVHVAAHGFHHDQNALFASVAMHDGPLFAYELQRRGVGAGHVVLSACDTGRAMMRASDESVGLTASLLACGARSVVAAVAPVRDAAAAELMVDYHRELAGGASAAVALQRASDRAADPDQARLFCTYGTDWSASGQDASDHSASDFTG